MDLQPGRRLDRYVVEGLLGQGGMAAVYRVRHEQLGTPYALKVLTLPARSIQQRLLQEGRVQAALRHPNVVSVTDVIEVDGAPGLVMELVTGPSLDAFLAAQQLSLDQADHLGRGILEGVAAAHEAGLIHRDLKPGNVLLEVRGGTLVPKITDFGLAKVLDGGESGTGMTRSGLAMGTPAYMAPEQIRNAKHVDHRADVFSLGALLYELLTTRRAFEGDDTFEVFSQVTSGRYRPVAELRPDAPQRMVDAIVGALQVDRDERVADVRSLLAIWAGGAPEPVVSGPFDEAAIRRATEMGSHVPATPDPSSGEPAPSLAQASGGADATMDIGGLDGSVAELAGEGPTAAEGAAAVGSEPATAEPAAAEPVAGGPVVSTPSLAPPSEGGSAVEASAASLPPPEAAPSASEHEPRRGGLAVLLGGGIVGVGLLTVAVLAAILGGGAVIALMSAAPEVQVDVGSEVESERPAPEEGAGGSEAPAPVAPAAVEPVEAAPDVEPPAEVPAARPSKPARAVPAVTRPPRPSGPGPSTPREPAAVPDAPDSPPSVPEGGAVEPAPAVPAEAEAPEGAEAPVEDTDPPADDAIGEDEPAADETVGGEGDAADGPTGKVTYQVAMHPMLKGAEAGGQIWLVGDDGSQRDPGDVPAGSYRIVGLLGGDKGDPIGLGQVTVPAGGAVHLYCYATIRECRTK